MGNNCSAYESKDDYQFLYELLSPTFGPLKLMRSKKLGKEVALKFLSFSSDMDLKQYFKLAQNARSYQKIPTLLKIIDCTLDQKPTCHSIGCYIHFEYIKNNLDSSLKQKKMLLSQFLVTNRDDRQYRSLNHIKFYDYDKIDKTSLLQRKYCNIHFLQVEILRMIDHILGAAFFLHHINFQQNSIRPQNILIDQQGKYLLVDKQLFRLKSNYQLALHSQKNIFYLSPQQLSSLKIKAFEPKMSSQLSDIFSIGLIALQMCTLESLSGLYDFQLMRFNVLQLNRLMSKSRQHYSYDFISLLQRMLGIDQSQRIDFSTLIDSLGPVLTKNVQNYNKVYGGCWTKDQDELSNKPNQQRFNDIHKRLSEIQQSFNRAISSKVIEKPYHMKQQHLKKQQQNILRKLKQAKKRKDKIKSQQQVKGNQLYQMYLKQYNSISQLRTKTRV